MKKIQAFVKKYGIHGTSIILKQAAIRLVNQSSFTRKSTIEAAEILVDLAGHLEAAFEEFTSPVTYHLPHEFNFHPDWSKRWIPAVAEDELKDFKFDGPGWYYYKNTKSGTVDTILALAGDDPEWFTFHIWNDRDARIAFELVAGLPTRRES